MFTNKKAKYYGDNKVLLDSACLSTDTKPTTGVANGSKCIEMDTGKTYMFNEEDSEWEELPSSGGGGGGSSDFSTAEVTITAQNFDPSVGMYWNFATILSDKLICANYSQQAATETHSVVLYKGACEAYIGGEIAATSGDIVIEDNIATVTGDCTITIS